MNRDLVHFLRLGLMRVRHRGSEVSAEKQAATTPEAAAMAQQEIETLKILEDLILEQVPHENIDHSAR